MDADFGEDVVSGDRISPASCMAACSSALVGSLMGDFVLDARGDGAADCLPHNAVALLTEANVDFSGDDSSFTGVTSTFGVAISLRGVDLGVSAAGLFPFAGGVGRGRENRDWNGAGEDDAKTGLGDCAGGGAGDFWGVA
jgi:hypothetical protein